ncbi:phosphoribosylglycinamide formyltransferase [Methylobacterium pseudosasicola]|uniref:Phosphoribosylglycinamide formyltransferase n=1 Tax=Methylobacterium pseudosasicola TaxID=582667 RepID=A0A1I4TCG0_9HYPH|nr:phosphoribosylglycinamide formyltransferase [Methylobacterium pseudosasicola]SFM74303.1 phosphoribosylglycinamide formyltransferase-1 [Methylobacterium pseudosasicola]
MAMSKKTRVAVLISGRGSNMVALIEAAKDPAYPAEIVLVLSNRPDAAGLARAAEAGIPARAIDHRAFPDRASFDAALDAELRAADIDLVCLAGFMRIFTPGFVAGWAGRMLNIHPSLLPLFKGTHTHAQALEAGVRLHGCTVHFVVPELDAGPIVAQAAIPVRQGDDPDSLAERVIVQERQLYPAVLALVAGGRARLDGDRVVIADAAPDGVLFSL